MAELIKIGRPSRPKYVKRCSIERTNRAGETTTRYAVELPSSCAYTGWEVVIHDVFYGPQAWTIIGVNNTNFRRIKYKD